jgi:phosphoribosylformimino-5-aminoimidazole carboxamide ribotide isomerase
MNGRAKFRPCIDIHNGKVKQLVGGSLQDKNDSAQENFVSEKDAAYFASLYKKDKLKGGHIIILNSKASDYYEQTREQALKALKAYPGGMQIGGGVTAANAKEYIAAGASHVIVTSFVFRDGKVDFERLQQLINAVGKEHIVLDLSCRKKDGDYYIVTDRWQKFTEEKIDDTILTLLSGYCDEFLVHGVDVEGKSGGMEEELVKILSDWSKIPITYAGGISTREQIEYFDEISEGKMDYTIGSALDLFGGSLKYDEIKQI